MKALRQHRRPWQFAVAIPWHFMSHITIEAVLGGGCAKEVPQIFRTSRVRPPMGVVHRRLRSATRGDHALIDRMLLPFDLQRPDDYRTFLLIHLAALITFQADLRLQDQDDVEQMLRCLKMDLETLGCTTTRPPITRCAAFNPSKALGIAYVVRGSRLGAAFLRRRVGAGFPKAFLDCMPALTWAKFLVQLEGIAGDAGAIEATAGFARSAFTTFATESSRFRDVAAFR
jgi:heme oxygenase (biliverdin-IX-beta and delta-forming)